MWMVTWQRRAHRRAAALESVQSRVAHLVDAVSSAQSPPPLDDSLLPAGTSLDPSAGRLDAVRAARKREQIMSAAAHAVELLRDGDHCIEFGAGQGHLGLLIAQARPDVSVTLVEVKSYSCDGARARVAALQMANCDVFCGTVDEFAASGAPIDCAVGLHLCGLLTDSVLELAIDRGSSVCIVPCCYGQIVGSTDHARGGGTTPCMHPRSTAFQLALGIGRRPAEHDCSSAAGGILSTAMLEEPTISGEEAFRTIAQAADTAIVGKGGEFDPQSAASLSAFHCMRMVDTDRCLHMVEAWVATRAATPRVSLGRLHPVTCTPKASLILLQRPDGAGDSGSQNGESAALVTDAAAAALLADEASPTSPTLGRSRWLALFGGQGAVGGQMRELRRVAREPAINGMLRHWSDCLARELEKWSEQPRAPAFEHGLDLHSWVSEPGSRSRAPDREYLERVEVSMPLILANQLACYAFAVIEVSTPATQAAAPIAAASATPPLLAALGHSQGAAAAAVAAAANSTEDLCEMGGAAISHVFWLGVRIAEAVTEAVDEEVRRAGVEAGAEADGGGVDVTDSASGGGDVEGGCLWALGIVKVTPEAVEAAIADHPLREPAEGGRLALVLRNGPLASVVTGLPGALSQFEEWLNNRAAREASNGAIEPGQLTLQGLRSRRLPIAAPFHHPSLLSGVPSLVAADTATLPKLCVASLRVPLISCADGCDMRTAPPETDLLQQVAIDVCTRPIDWPRAHAALLQAGVGQASQAVVDFGPGGGCGCLQLVHHVSIANVHDQAAENAPPACYFSQLPSFEPGPLPASWLRFTAPLNPL